MRAVSLGAGGGARGRRDRRDRHGAQAVDLGTVGEP